jgi:hypothetical protein
MVEY